MRVLVCGGREFSDKELLDRELYAVCEEFGVSVGIDRLGKWFIEGITVIHGAARGADQLAGEWAAMNGVPCEEYPADWTTHGKAAGLIRNREMLRDGKPDLVIAFPTEKSRGTWHMVNISTEAGVPVRVITL